MTKRYSWSDEKNEWLKRERGFGFEDVVIAIETGSTCADEAHTNPDFVHQRKMFVDMGGYIVVVPYIKEGDRSFLKTAYPSRKATKDLLGALRES